MTPTGTKKAMTEAKQAECEAMLRNLRELLRLLGARNATFRGLVPKRALVMHPDPEVLSYVRSKLTVKELALVGAWEVVSESTDD